MSLTKATYSMIQGASRNVLDFGADPTGVADSAAAFQAAVDSVGSANIGIFVPAGEYRIDSTVFLDNCDLIGDGINVTKIDAYAAGDCFRLGKRVPSPGIVIGGSIQKLIIRLYGISSIGIRVLSCENAAVRDIFISSSYGFPNTQTGVVIDGGSGSGFFNEFGNINVVGPDVGYKFEASAGGFLTQQYFNNCSALTYPYNPTSVGFLFEGNNGIDSTFVAGNLEFCKKGFQFDTTSPATTTTAGLTLVGVRFEANITADIDWGNGGSLITRLGYANFGNNAGRTYTFTISASSAEFGAVYSNNGINFRVMNTISGATSLVAFTGPSGGAPTGSGTLTKVSGVGDATIAFSSSTFVLFNSDLNFDNTKSNGFMQGSSVNGVTINADPGSNFGFTNQSIGSNAFRTAPNGTRRDNLAVGHDALSSLTTGTNNTAIGSEVLVSRTTQNNATAVGTYAGQNATGGEAVFIGVSSGRVTTGSGNSFVGYGSGDQCTSGANNIAIGQFSGSDVIGTELFQLTTENNRIIIGDDRATDAYVNVPWTIVSDGRDKTSIENSSYGLSFVQSLRPVKYKRDDRSRYKEIDIEGNVTEFEQDGSRADDHYSIGFIAQEVIEAEKSAGAIDGEFLIADDEDVERLKITETRIIPALVKAIQELKAELDAYKANHP